MLLKGVVFIILAGVALLVFIVIREVAWELKRRNGDGERDQKGRTK
jgi:hypothetical protein